MLFIHLPHLLIVTYILYILMRLFHICNINNLSCFNIISLNLLLGNILYRFMKKLTQILLYISCAKYLYGILN